MCGPSPSFLIRANPAPMRRSGPGSAIADPGFIVCHPVWYYFLQIDDVCYRTIRRTQMPYLHGIQRFATLAVLALIVLGPSVAQADDPFAPGGTEGIWVRIGDRGDIFHLTTHVGDGATGFFAGRCRIGVG